MLGEHLVRRDAHYRTERGSAGSPSQFWEVPLIRSDTCFGKLDMLIPASGATYRTERGSAGSQSLLRKEIESDNLCFGKLDMLIPASGATGLGSVITSN
jgi:hypothetical protein